jgi:hypothetical protein
MKYMHLALIALGFASVLMAVEPLFHEPTYFKCASRLDRIELTRLDTSYAVTITESALSSTMGISQFFAYLWPEHLRATYQIDFAIPRQIAIPLVGNAQTCATISSQPSLIMCELTPVEKKVVRVNDLTNDAFGEANAGQFTIRTGKASETHLRLDSSRGFAETNHSITVFVQLFGEHFPFVKGGATHSYAFLPEECDAK